VRICLVYDHLFPQTIGGAEKWMRDLALRLVESGHDVTYLTMRHWDPEVPPSPRGIRVLGLTTAGRVYDEERRALLPPLRFGFAVGRHLARHGRDYDVVHLASFPYFPVLAAQALRRRRGYRVVVDWHEVWSLGYWRHYAGTLVGSIGWLVQRRCIRSPHRAFCFSRMNSARLVAEGYRGTPAVLGLYDGPTAPTPLDRVESEIVLYAGRHIREKRIDALVHGFARARELRPGLRLEIFGDGPTTAGLVALVDELGLAQGVTFAGRRPEEEVAEALARAACVATASEREGYGVVVVEAAARGTPSVVVAGSENAATELVLEGVNGAVAADASAERLAEALLRVLDAGPSLRESTTRWFAEHAAELTIERSLATVLDSYSETERPRPEAVAAR
jgi:glycosyltransferase involved in cell wall biosynthesis